MLWLLLMLSTRVANSSHIAVMTSGSVLCAHMRATEM